MAPKRKRTERQPFRNVLGNDALSLIAQFVVKHKNSCEEMEVFLSHFARPGVWRVVAQKLGWGLQVSTRKDFVERCHKDRQNRLASQYDHQKRLTHVEFCEEWSAPWHRTNEWVVPGLVLYDSASMDDFDGTHLEYFIKSKKGQQKVRLGLYPDPHPSDRIGIAMMKMGPSGAAYVVKMGRKRFQLSHRRDQ